jgi:PD-(D/E)XK endonuclease
MSESTLKGAIAEAAISLEASKLAFVVLRPQSEGRRYDIVIDVGPRLLRVQCKWGRLHGNVIVVETSTRRLTPHGYVHTTYGRQEVDGVAAYCQELERCFWLPIELVAGRRGFSLRLVPTANNQALAINWASDYDFGAIAQLGERRHGMAEAGGSSPPSSTPRPLT